MRLSRYVTRPDIISLALAAGDIFSFINNFTTVLLPKPHQTLHPVTLLSTDQDRHLGLPTLTCPPITRIIFRSDPHRLVHSTQGYQLKPSSLSSIAEYHEPAREITHAACLTHAWNVDTKIYRQNDATLVSRQYTPSLLYHDLCSPLILFFSRLAATCATPNNRILNAPSPLRFLQRCHFTPTLTPT